MINRKTSAVIVVISLFFISQIIMLLHIISLRNSVKLLDEKIDSFETSLAGFKENESLQIERLNDQIFVMNRTYDGILSENKQKTIDTAERDTNFIKAKKNALLLYKAGRYSDSYDEYKKLMQLHADDMECRLYKAKSLFYKNRSDSSSYMEIMEDIMILKQNGASDEEILKIEQSIMAEKEGLNG